MPLQSYNYITVQSEFSLPPMTASMNRLALTAACLTGRVLPVPCSPDGFLFSSVAIVSSTVALSSDAFLCTSPLVHSKGYKHFKGRLSKIYSLAIIGWYSHCSPSHTTIMSLNQPVNLNQLPESTQLTVILHQDYITF